MIACIIPARGGSKGIPRKNLLKIGGLSLVARSVLHAIAADSVDEVWVSTDDPDIADEAKTHGADVHWREPDTATDTASSESAITDWLNAHFYDDSASRNQAMGARWAGARADPEAVVFLQATSPLRHATDIDRAVAQWVLSNADSVFGARRVEGYVWKDDGTAQPQYRTRERRQDETAAWWEENGSLYVFRTALFRKERRRLCGVVRPFQMHALRSFQIDEPGDVETLQAIHDVWESQVLAPA